MKRVLPGLFLLILIVFATAGQAQNPVKFSGQVKDIVYATAVAGATLKITGAGTFNTQTDSLGRFVINLLPGNYNLSVSNVGYVTYT